MLLKEVKKKLFSGMDAIFFEMGFSLYKPEHWYERKLNGDIQIFYFIFHKKPDGIYVEPRWAIKIKKILDIYHLVSAKDKKYFKYTPVLENSLGEMIEYVDNKNQTGTGKLMSYLIENENDIETLITVIPKRFKEYVLPYFNANSSISQINRLLNTQPRELSVHNWLYPQKAIMGVIAAKLVGNPEYEDLVGIYSEELARANPTSKQEFQELIELLKNVIPIR